jgi:type VI secretion system VasD/TssJ family lipoprotein
VNLKKIVNRKRSNRSQASGYYNRTRILAHYQNRDSLLCKGGAQLKRNAHLRSLFLILILVCSCASQPLPPAQPEPAPKAIRLQLISNPQLNYYNNLPHSLLVCVYQLSNLNELNQLSEDTEGMYKLRECALFDSSVTQAKRLIIHPNQDLNLELDRAQGTKYVAIVAGYQLLEKERVIRLFEIPEIEEKKGWIRRTKTLKLAPLDISLRLGPQQIESI